MNAICIKPVLWDNCLGQYVEAFSIEQEIEITKHSDGSWSAESLNYPGITDFVPKSHFN